MDSNGAGKALSNDVLEAYIKQLLEAHRVPQVTVAWQGGEPMLIGLDFNDILLDDEWRRFFRDELDVHYLQFIPTVERENETGFQEGDEVTGRSVSPAQWGRFLIEIFDEWVRRDVGRSFVLNFDGALAGWLGMAGTLCIFGPTCGLGMVLEHNGDL